MSRRSQEVRQRIGGPDDVAQRLLEKAPMASSTRFGGISSARRSAAIRSASGPETAEGRVDPGVRGAIAILLTAADVDVEK